MSIFRLKSAALAAALLASGVSAQAVTLLSEDFASVATLAGSGWVLTNASSPVGSTGWFQGDSTIFAAQSGAAESYAAANYNNAASGGIVSNWLITPTFSTATEVVISFWAKGINEPGYFDVIGWGLSTGSSAIGSFDIQSATILPASWTKYTVHLDAQGAGTVARFAISYGGFAAAADYIGVDTLTVTAVPEPANWLMLGAGVLGLAVRRRLGADR